MMRFLEMKAVHVPQVAALEKLCFADPWSENSVASELNNDLALWLVAMNDDTVVGYIGSQTVAGETGAQILALDSLQVVTDESKTYLETMQKNLAQLRRALS